MSERVTPTRTAAFEARLKKRYAAERRFKAIGLSAIVFSVAVLLFLLATMTINGIGGFQRAELRVDVDFPQMGLSLPPEELTVIEAQQRLSGQGLREVVQFSAEQTMGAEGAAQLNGEAWRLVAEQIHANPGILQREASFWLPTTEDLASAYAGDGQLELQPLAQDLAERGFLEDNFDVGFLTRADATDPQLVGIWGALKGSMLTMIVTLLLAFPIGVLAALYLEEYAPKNRWTDFIEVSINNLAAVPSIIFGLLGMAVFLTIFPSMRSAPLIWRYDTGTDDHARDRDFGTQCDQSGSAEYS